MQPMTTTVSGGSTMRTAADASKKSTILTNLRGIRQPQGCTAIDDAVEDGLTAASEVLPRPSVDDEQDDTVDELQMVADDGQEGLMDEALATTYEFTSTNPADALLDALVKQEDTGGALVTARRLPPWRDCGECGGDRRNRCHRYLKWQPIRRPSPQTRTDIADHEHGGSSDNETMTDGSTRAGSPPTIDHADGSRGPISTTNDGHARRPRHEAHAEKSNTSTTLACTSESIL